MALNCNVSKLDTCLDTLSRGCVLSICLKTYRHISAARLDR